MTLTINHRRRAATDSHRMAVLFLVLVGILFFGQVVIPQFVLFVLPGLGPYLTQGQVSFGFFSITIIGFLFSAILTLPFLIYFIRSSPTAQKELEAH